MLTLLERASASDTKNNKGEIVGILSLIGTLGTTIVGLVANWLQSRTDLAKAKVDLQLADIQNRADLLRDKQRFNAQWERTALVSSGKTLKWFSFCMFSAPFFIAMIAPHAVADYFNVAVQSIPADWRTMWYAINGSIWGIAAVKDHFLQILMSIRSKTMTPEVMNAIIQNPAFPVTSDKGEDNTEQAVIPEPFSK